MSLIKYGKFLYGVREDKPTLPFTFRYIEADGHWLFAYRELDDTYWYVTTTHLYRRRVATMWDRIRTFGGLRVGQWFVDTRSKIKLTK